MSEIAKMEGYRLPLDVAQRHAPDDSEYWLARELQEILNYARWENFLDVIRKAMQACDNSGEPPNHHFRQTAKVIRQGKGVQRKIDDWFLSRYACYLIAINGDPRVEQVAYAQQYFAVQTRLQEQSKQYDLLAHRRRVTGTVKALNSAARTAGVQRYGLFHDAGYRGLYGGLGLTAIKARKGIDPKEDLLDRAGHIELAAIELKNAITREKLIDLNVQNEQQAMDTHHQVGNDIRGALRSSGVTPEDLKPDEPIKNLKSRQRKLIPPPSSTDFSRALAALCAVAFFPRRYLSSTRVAALGAAQTGELARGTV